MNHVYVFEVLLPPKGMPFQVRVHGECVRQATQRVQQMHRQCMVRLISAHEVAGGVPRDAPGGGSHGEVVPALKRRGFAQRNASLL